MSGMGRPKSAWKDAPPRMTRRPRKRGGFNYYYQAAGKKTPLGTDQAAALRRWAVLEAGNIGSRFKTVGDAFLSHLQQLLKPESYRHYERSIENLGLTFAKFTLEQIEPKHVKKYILLRSKKGAAILEKKVLSALFNWARGEGLTTAPNPCSGIKFSQSERASFGKIGRRDVYVTDAMFAEVYGQAGPVLQDAMDLLLLTGQRPGDVLKMSRQDIREGALWIVQQKTGAKVGIRIEGDLKRVLERIQARPRRIQTMLLIATEAGQRIRLQALDKQFAKARGEATWQLRDIRAKTGTDSESLSSAQKILGHAAETTTVLYRRRKGEPVPPLK